MIIPVVGKYDEDEYVICPRVPITVANLRRRMLQRAKVTEGSYAYRLIDTLHAAIFVQSLDLRADYSTYFACEYYSFREYLSCRSLFPSPVAAKLIDAFDVSVGIYHFRPSYAFLADRYGLEFLTLLLEESPTGEASS